MNRKEKRDGKNANHRRNEQRRFDRRIDKMFAPWRDMLDESARYAVQQQAFEEAVNSGVFG
jgi:hypothetical protein